jgi:excisionase family DNA binding protein
MSGVLLSAAEVAEMLGVRRDWVYAQSRAGRIPTITLGRYRRYRREAIEDWISSLERASVRPGPQDGRAAQARAWPGSSAPDPHADRP